MVKEQEKEDFLRLCKAIVTSCPDYHCEDIFVRWLSKYNTKNRTHYKWTCGCSRFVVMGVFWVLKWNVASYPDIDFMGNCDTETEIYEQAKKDGFEYLFARGEKITISYQNFYFYPRIPNVGYRAHHDKELVDYCTEEEYDYISERISDLHDENWGIQNGHAIIIDYACLQGSSDEEE